MAKLGKSQIPAGHTFNDFAAFGPVATKDGDFSGTKIADFGCFAQDQSDKNKFYHASILKSKINNNWYTYFEWGRTGKTRDFQFAEFSTESAAQAAYEKQCHSKNDKRGIWVDMCGHRTLQAKKNRDVYLVRVLAGRDTNIPDANTITNAPQVTTKPIKTVASKKYDTQSESLLRDLIGGTVNYARSSMTTGVLPSQDAIDLARKILMQAQKELSVSNKQGLRDLTYQLYSRIPKYKPRNAGEDYWLLNSNNIFEWQNDLDAYESALSNQYYVESRDDFGELSFEIKWIDPRSELGEFLYRWWPNATEFKHHYGRMKIKGMWEIFRDDTKFKAKRQQIRATNKNEVPLFQNEIVRSDLDVKSNLYWLFHGSRSANICSILKNGLKLPNQLSGVQLTGALLGGGAYTADNWQKSAGYTSLGNSYWARGSGNIANRKAFMFTCEVILGNIYVAGYGYGKNEPPPGYHSVMGKAGKSGLANNEYVVYDTDQCKIRYLLEFDTN